MTGEDYVPRPPGRFVTFAQQPGGPPPAPYTWPQDTLRVPSGFGAMPLVNNLNANRSRREFFGVSAQFLNMAPDTLRVQNIPLDKDGDFWLSGIAVQSIDPTAASPAQQIISGVIAFLGLADGVTGFSLTSEYYDSAGVLIQGVPWSAFESPQLITSAGSLTPFNLPYGGGTRTELIQPYCFLRGGAVRVSLRTPPVPVIYPVLNLYLSLVGWKEYAYAAA
jgi:hypothetical protein